MNRRVTREDWLQAAVQALAEGGFAALAIEPLARRLEVTKGSFYNYYPSLDGFIRAVLSYWEEQATSAVIETLDAIPDPATRLERLFDVVWERVDHLKAEAALAAAAVAGDARVRPVYLRVNRSRLAYTRKLYASFGLSAAEAREYALTAYGSYLGTLQLIALDSGTFRTQAELGAHAAHVRRILVPRMPPTSKTGSRR